MKRRHAFALMVLLIAGVGLVAVLANRVERTLGVSVPVGTLAPLRAAPEPGVYPDGVAVDLQPYQARGQIAVTVDGTLPTIGVGTLYRGPIRFDAEHAGVRVLRAAEVNGDTTGPLLTASYVVGLAPELPVVSIVADPVDLWDAETGILANPGWRGREWERSIHVTFFLDGDAYGLPGGVRVSGGLPLDAPKPSLRLYAREEYGVDRVEVPLFPIHARQSAQGQSYKRLLLQAGEHSVVWSLLRDQVVGAVARDLGLPVAEGRFVWLFVNGSSWGLYRLTERVDRFMLEDDFGFSNVDVLQEGDPRDGSGQDWDALVDWAEAGDVSDPEVLTQFAARVDLENFTDTAIIYQFFDLPADAFVAVQPQGGRWFWIFEGGTSEDVGMADFDVLLAALLANPAYQQQFERRFADLANTLLEPASIAARVGKLEANSASSFDYERARWPGVPPWQEETAAVERAFGMRWLDLAERISMSTLLSLRTSPPAAGALYVDGFRVAGDASAWQGQYVEDGAVTLIAVPEPGYDFAGWSGDSSTTSAVLAVSMRDPVSLTAKFEPRLGRQQRPYPDDVVINELWINDDGTQYPTLGHLALEGDWVELLVRSADPVDLRGWRLTDNDTKIDDGEGSIILPDLDGLAAVPCGTVVLVVATESPANTAAFPVDDLDAADGRLIFYVGNGVLDVTTDPGFGLGPRDDNLVLLAPGLTDALGDDVGVDFVAEGQRVTPYTFGVLADGVAFDEPFDHLGGDDGAVFVGRTSNDDIANWHVDPTACESYDVQCLDAAVVVSPGRLNPGQQLFRQVCFVRRLQARPLLRAAQE